MELGLTRTSPEIVLGLVEELLDQAVRAGPAGPRHAGQAPIQVHVEADQMDRRVLPGVRNGVRFPIDLDRLRWQQATVAQLLEQGHQPLLAGRGGRRVVLGELDRTDWKPDHTPTNRFHERLIASLTFSPSARWYEAGVKPSSPEFRA